MGSISAEDKKVLSILPSIMTIHLEDYFCTKIVRGKNTKSTECDEKKKNEMILDHSR